jgi:hypothetical protein
VKLSLKNVSSFVIQSKIKRFQTQRQLADEVEGKLKRGVADQPATYSRKSLDNGLRWITTDKRQYMNKLRNEPKEDDKYNKDSCV